MRKDRIVIVEYDPVWPQMFTEQAHRLHTVLSPWLMRPVEHIGSTSIPGLPAKPIIDMLALIDDYDGFADALPRAESIGWKAAPEPGDREGRQRSLCFPSVELRSHHLHVVEARSGHWKEWLMFRDHLRAHPDLAAQYARLKTGLAAEDDTDRPRYRSAKAPFIRSVLAAITSPPNA